MREILFRGKRIDNGEWVEGNLVRNDNGKDYFIVFMGDDYLGYFWEIIVDPNTIGQYTGLTDKNGKRIFEGDIIKSYQGKVLAVKFGQYRDDEECVSGNGWYVYGEYGTLSFDERWGGHEVIGNIHDNSERLRGDKHDTNT